jgi:hypothetical protein
MGPVGLKLREKFLRDTDGIPISRQLQAYVCHRIQFDLEKRWRVFSVSQPTTVLGQKKTHENQDQYLKSCAMHSMQNKTSLLS